MEVHDLNATILDQLGIDHEKLTYKFQGAIIALRTYTVRAVKGVLT